ncbi:MAG TPA: NAD(P) transhydrogenase subunit alpha [Alphaproteobacteria bacterium]|nr:NAD(P) transhydrogenase subunit alpha [Alphaproteobacteria bacterium]
MDPTTLADHASRLATGAAKLADDAARLAYEATQLGAQQAQGAGLDPAVIGLTVFVLACFVGYYVVWKVTPALHSPLMSVTNAISSVIIVGALLAAGPADLDFSKFMGFAAVTLASVNIFGGFIVTQRMLQMFQRRK